jgi:hypothetical protein
MFQEILHLLFQIPVKYKYKQTIKIKIILNLISQPRAPRVYKSEQKNALNRKNNKWRKDNVGFV